MAQYLVAKTTKTTLADIQGRRRRLERVLGEAIVKTDLIKNKNEIKNSLLTSPHRPTINFRSKFGSPFSRSSKANTRTFHNDFVTAYLSFPLSPLKFIYLQSDIIFHYVLYAS